MGNFLKRHKIAQIFVFFTLFSICVLGVLTFSWANPSLICFNTLFPSYTDVAEHSFFEVPYSANDVEYTTNTLSRKAGCTIWVKFKMHAQEIESFKSSSLISDFEPNLLSDGEFLYYLQQKDWNQTKGALAGYGFAELNDIYISQWIFFETLENEQYRVYIVVNKEWL